MARINKEQIVTNALREEGLKIIGSDKSTSTEKMHWSKLLFDMQDVTKQELTVQVKQAEDAREVAETALKTSQDALDAANVKIAELEPSALRLPGVETEHAELKANFDARVAAMREELVSEAQQHEWNANRAENAAKERLQEVQRQFSQTGLQLLLDELQKIVQQYNVPEPDPASLPKGISSLILTAWGHSPTRATYMLSYAKAFDSPNEAFKNTLLRFLRTGLLQPEGMRQLDPITDFDVRRAVLVDMAQRWNVLNEVQRIADDEAVQRRADFLRNTNAIHQAQQREFSRLGYGRSEIAVAEPVPVTGYTGPHDPDCCCGRPGCNPLPVHLRADVWLGTRPTVAKDDINEVHTVDLATLNYGKQLIERERLAKEGKIVTVDPPDSMTKLPPLGNDEKELLP